MNILITLVLSTLLCLAKSFQIRISTLRPISQRWDDSPKTSYFHLSATYYKEDEQKDSEVDLVIIQYRYSFYFLFSFYVY